MKICIITKFFQGIHKCSGGMEAHVKDLIIGLKKNKDIEISIITSEHPKKISYEKRDGVEIFFVKGKISRNPFSRYRYFNEVGKKLKELNYEKKFDILHIQSDFGVGYINNLNSKIPIITTVHGTALDEFFGSIKTKPYLLPIWAVSLPIYYLTEKRMLEKSNKIIAVSELIKEDEIKQHQIPSKKIKTIYNGIDLNKFKSFEEKKIKSLKEKFKDKKIILSVGNIIKQKGYHLLIEILPEIIKKEPKTLLLIGGEGNYLKDLKEIAEKNKSEKNILFLGKIKREKLPKYYNLSDIFAFPSLRGEGLPYVLIEAMACGKSVISSPSGGIVNIIKNNKNGLLVKKGDKKELLKGILNLLRDKKLRARLGKEARKTIRKKFDLKKMIKKYKETYQDLCK